MTSGKVAYRTETASPAQVEQIGSATLILGECRGTFGPDELAEERCLTRNEKRVVAPDA